MTRRPLVAFLAAGLVLAATFATAGWAADPPASRGANWLASRQGPNGAVPEGARPDQVAEAVVALVAGAANEESIGRAMAYIAERGAVQTTRGGHVARVILGALATRHDPRALGGVDYVARLESEYNATTGTYDGGVYANGLAFLARLALGAKLTPASRTYITANQCSDGGFAHDTGCTKLPDVDTTAVMLRVLARDGADTASRDKARDWLARAQNRDGGFPLDRGGITNANSTGLALLAIADLGATPGEAPWSKENGSPLDAILRLQLSTGAFRFVPGGGENEYATIQAVPAVARFQPASAGTPPAPGVVATAARPPAPPAAPAAGSPSTSSLGATSTTASTLPAPLDANDEEDVSAAAPLTSGEAADEPVNPALPLLAAVLLAGAAYLVFAQYRRPRPS